MTQWESLPVQLLSCEGQILELTHTVGSSLFTVHISLLLSQQLGLGIENQLQFKNQKFKVRNRLLGKFQFQFRLSIFLSFFFFCWRKGDVTNVFVFELFIQEIH